MKTTETKPAIGIGLAFALIRCIQDGRITLAAQSPQPPVEKPADEKIKAAPITKLAVGRNEAADLLSVSVTTFDRWVKRGQINASGVSRRRIFAVTELQRFLRETSETIDL